MWGIVGERGPNVQAVSCCFPRQMKELDGARTRAAPMWDAALQMAASSAAPQG